VKDLDKGITLANINSKWERIVAIGCTHGNLVHKEVLDSALAFVDRYKPTIRVHLGDLLETTAFRSGARGTKDEGVEIAPDYAAGIDLIERYQPTHITWGNHDVRLLDLATSPSAIVSHAAGTLWNQLVSKADEVGAKTKPYDIELGWFRIGGHYWGHGYMYNVSAVRDHAEMVGGPIVMAHIHRPEESRARTFNQDPSYCVGTLANIRQMHYARRRRATMQWGHGMVFGEVCEMKNGGKSRLWLAQSAPNELLQFPL
jgi:hypothetical protein